MGKKTGFLEFKRNTLSNLKPQERILHFKPFHNPLPRDKQAIQGARCMDCGVPFCQSGSILAGMTSGCPLHNLIPEWNDLIYHQQYKEAFYRLLQTNNFPEFTARVCPAPCEAACTCSLHDEAVTIKENEYGIISYAYETGLMKARPPILRLDKKVAIIGSGPAGLSAADELNKRGYQVTIYERDNHLGGLLMYGIPNMKLDKEVIHTRIAMMKEEGIIFKTNCGIETKEQVEVLEAKYDAIILACGSRVPRDIKVPGREGKGIYFALEYLTKTTKEIVGKTTLDIDVKNKTVVVIGGGDTGNDCIATAIRHQCKDVIQLEMMPELPKQRTNSNPWPEWPKVKKIDYGQEESIAVFNKDPRRYQTTVKEFILDENKQLQQIRLVSLTTEMIDGKVQIQEVPNSEEVIRADVVFIAAGFIGAEKHVAEAFGLDLTIRGNIVNQTPYQTTKENVFVAGDMRRGQSLVVWAIKEGREVAQVVHQKYLSHDE